MVYFHGYTLVRGRMVDQRVSIRLGATTAPFQDSLALPIAKVAVVTSEPAEAHLGAADPEKAPRELLISGHAGGVLLWAGMFFFAYV